MRHAGEPGRPPGIERSAAGPSPRRVMTNRDRATMSTSTPSEAQRQEYAPAGQISRRPALGAAAVRAHPLAWYFGLSYGITWLVWLPLMLDPRRALATSPWWPLHFLGLSGPFAAGLIVGGWSEGREGVRELLAAFRPRRVQARWLALATLLPLASWVIAVGLTAVHFGSRAPSPALLVEWPKLPRFGPVAGLLFLFVTSGVGEEGGWRGFALPRLQTRHRPFAATLLLVVGWAGWHIPLFFHDPSFAAMTGADVAGWMSSLLAGALVLTWLYNGSRGSALATALFHTGTNFVWMSRAVDGPVSSTLGACMILFAIAVVPLLRRVRPVVQEDGPHAAR
jgi:uncharacterized protein